MWTVREGRQRRRRRRTEAELDDSSRRMAREIAPVPDELVALLVLDELAQTAAFVLNGMTMS